MEIKIYLKRIFYKYILIQKMLLLFVRVYIFRQYSKYEFICQNKYNFDFTNRNGTLNYSE